MQNFTPESDGLNPNGKANNALKDFQISGNVKEKSSEDYGKKIIVQVEQIINSGYFADRNRRFAINRAMFTGRMDITKFMDFFNINGKTNYVNINWKAIMIVNTIVARLVGRWMTKKQKASVTAVDPVSVKKKQDKIDEAEFFLYNKNELAALSQESGVKLIPDDQFIPDDKDQLDLWAKDELRVPEEILYELGINTVFDQNDWGDMGINTRRHKIDSAVVGLIGKETIADKNGKIIDKYLKPENIFYSYSEYDDFRDADIKGVIESYKIADLRNDYPKLDVKELVEISKFSKDWQESDKIAFQNSSTWNMGSYLPIDDWNVDVVRFTLKSVDVDKSLIKRGKDGGMYVDKPKKKIDDLYPGNEYVEKTQENIYRGVYVRGNKQILQWGLEKNMIKPQEYEKINHAYSPFSFYMYQNDKMRNLAVPEKIEEPIEGMILARLKIQQMIAKLTPSGHSYDIDGLQNMDLGNGICTPLELRKITDQTGDIYYRSRDTEGNRYEKPIQENTNVAGLAQLEGLIAVYNHHLQVLRDEVGINEFAEGQTIKPRTGQANVQTALEISFNATDYMNDATISCQNESANKIACLLHDSVEFGSEQYREIMQEEDVKGRAFDVKIEMLPTTEEITDFENTLNNAINNSPDLVLYLNPEKIKRIAKENVKLGEQYYRIGTKRAIEGRMKQAQQQSEMNSQIQRDAGIAVEKEKQNTMQMEMQVKTQIELALAESKNKQTILNGVFGIYQKGLPIPAELQSLTQEIITNVGLPLFAQNKDMAQGMQEQAMADQQEQEAVANGEQVIPEEQSMEMQEQPM